MKRKDFLKNVSLFGSGILLSRAFHPLKAKAQVKDNVNTFQLDKVYPIGMSILTMSNTFNPSDAFGGTWEKSTDGYYLCTASTGGTYKKATNVGSTALTKAQIPAHSHSVSAFSTTDGAGTHSHGGTPFQFYGCAGQSASPDSRGWAGVSGSTSQAGGHNHTIPAHNTNNTGSGQGHTHTMGTPNTITVIMWIRIA